MAQRKPYNPNTAYGRRKLREQGLKEYNELPPDKKFDRNILGIVILIVVCLVV